MITAYHAGYHKITRIVKRWENKTKDTDYARNAYSIMGEFTDECGKEINSLIYYKQILDSKGNPKKSQEKCCDIDFCKPALDSVQKEIETYTEIIQKLSNLKTKLS